MVGFVGQGTGQADDVRLAEHRRQGFPEFRAGARFRVDLAIGPVVEHGHVKTTGAPRHGLPDGAEADNTQGGAVYPAAQGGRTPGPIVFAEGALALPEPTAGGQQQGHGEVCRVLCYHRCVADCDSRGLRGGQVDVVSTDAQVGDQSQAVGEGFDQCCRHRVHGGAEPNCRAIEAGGGGRGVEDFYLAE